jgi:hypothetical protein
MHTIRLRGPWLVVREGQSTTVEFPAIWQTLQDQFGPGSIQLVRRFGLPTGIEPKDQLTLVIDARHFLKAATLNGQALGDFATHGARFDVTSQLKLRNELALSAQLPADAAPEALGATIAEVRLEITQAEEATSR